MDIDFTFSDALTDGLLRGAAAHLDFSPVMSDIAALMLDQARLRFEDGEGPDGISWLPSARAIEQGGKTLIDTGALRDSLMSDHDSVSAIVGTNLVYAGLHQRGGPYRGRQSATSQNLPKPRRMPARPFLGFGEQELEEIPALLAEFLGTAFGEGRA